MTLASSSQSYSTERYMNGRVFTSSTSWEAINVILKNAYISVFAVIFCRQCSTYNVHIDCCYHAILKHSSRSQHISLLTTCTFMFRQVCTTEPSFFKDDIGYASSSLRGWTSSSFSFQFIWVPQTFLHF